MEKCFEGSTLKRSSLDLGDQVRRKFQRELYFTKLRIFLGPFHNERRNEASLRLEHFFSTTSRLGDNCAGCFKWDTLYVRISSGREISPEKNCVAVKRNRKGPTRDKKEREREREREKKWRKKEQTGKSTEEREKVGGRKILVAHVNTFKHAVLPTTKYFPREWYWLTIPRSASYTHPSRLMITHGHGKQKLFARSRDQDGCLSTRSSAKYSLIFINN